jgi:hypothetical protein
MENHEGCNEEIGKVGQGKTFVGEDKKRNRCEHQHVFKKPVIGMDGVDGGNDPNDCINQEKELQQPVFSETGADPHG